MLADRVARVVAAWVAEEAWEDAPPLVIERPADSEHGDYATPFCMQLAKVARRAPRALAQELIDRLQADPSVSELVESLDVAGPGFLNLRLRPEAYLLAARALLAAGDDVGRGARERPLHILLEYVSVNPNGPLHVGHGRYAAYGNSLDRLLRYSGHKVTSEFYINDYGRQMEMFGRSVSARYAQLFGLDLAVPEEGYQGDYVIDLATQIREEIGDRWVEHLRTEGLDDASTPAIESLQVLGYRLVLDQMRAELERFRVMFDRWFSETPLHAEGLVLGTIDQVLESGDAYRLDDAVWLRTSPYGDDKDRVLIRSNERPTYFAADIAYHQDKLARGYDHLINIWGADHHGYVQRMKAAVEILSHDPDMLELIIGQMVNLLEEGELRQMSTRRGEMVTLGELIDAVGVDAARFFLVMRSHDQTLDLDLSLARRQSQENPVYYVQYAHARIAGILRNVPPELKPSLDMADAEGGLFETTFERDLIKKLDEFGDVVREAADRRAPHRVAAYAQEVAAAFHPFYKNCRVIGSDPEVAAARLALCLVTGRVVARSLDLLGVAAPESM
jgi:arginyl-tRNA synthetase